MKKYIGLLSFILLVSIFLPTYVFAASDEAKTKEKLEQLSEKYGVEFKTDYEGGTIEFESMEEFEKWIKDFKYELADYKKRLKENEKKIENELKSKLNNQTDLTNELNESAILTSDTKSGSHTMETWEPLWFLRGEGAFIWHHTNVHFDYRMVNGIFPEFTDRKVFSIDSYDRGLNYVSWHQTGSGHANYSTVTIMYDKASVTTDGYWLVGANVGGVNIGTTFDESYTKSFYLGDLY